MDPPPTSPAPAFDLSGGSLCLDFANTCSRRPGAARERLDEPRHLLVFAVAAGCAGPQDVAAVEATLRNRPADARTELETARCFREALYRILSAVAAARPVTTADLDLLNGGLRTFLTGLGAEPPPDDGPPLFRWRGPEADGSLSSLLHPVASDAVRVLTNPELLSRVRECDAPTCSWLFLDESRNRSRRWCSMQVCGNRAKARRHYRRERAGRDDGRARTTTE